MLKYKSTSDHVTTDNRTAKSPMIDRTYTQQHTSPISDKIKKHIDKSVGSITAVKRYQMST